MKTQKLKNYLKIGILLFSFAFTSCENDELDTKISTSDLKKFKQEFDSKLINDELLLGENNFQVDWNSGDIVYYSESKNKTVYEFNAYLVNPITIESELFYIKNSYKLTVTQQEDQTKYTVILFEPYKESENLSPNYRNINSFSGNKYELNQLGRIESLETYKDGKIIASLDLTKKVKNTDSNLASRSVATPPCPIDEFSCGDGGSGSGFVRETTYHYTDWYQKYDNTWYYTHTVYEGKSTQWVYVEGDYSGGITHNVFTAHGPSGSVPVNNNFSIENLIKTTNLNPCSEAALNKLKAATGTDIAAIMNKFNSSTNYNITIQTSPTSLGTAVAQTNYIDSKIPYNYAINISPDYSSSTELFRAATLLHEITHAYFLSLKDDFNAGIQPGSNVYNDNATLFQFYVTHTYPSSYSYDAHHEEMAKTYVNSIASALQEFQTGIPTILGGTPNQIYTDLAWGGLKGTPIYNSTFKEGSDERQRIENRYACEQVGHPVGYGTPQQQNTIGKPCQ